MPKVLAAAGGLHVPEGAAHTNSHDDSPKVVHAAVPIPAPIMLGCYCAGSPTQSLGNSHRQTRGLCSILVHACVAHQEAISYSMIAGRLGHHARECAPLTG